MTTEQSLTLQRQLYDLSGKHRELDTLIDLLVDCPNVDQLSVRRMKQHRLRLKDSIKRIKSRLIPDLDA